MGLAVSPVSTSINGHTAKSRLLNAISATATPNAITINLPSEEAISTRFIVHLLL